MATALKNQQPAVLLARTATADAGPQPSAQLSGWRGTGIGVLRITFGVIWAIDAYFKWLPAFHDNFDDYLAKGADGQPPVVQAWVNFWITTVGVNAHLFGYLVAAVFFLQFFRIWPFGG